MTRSRRGSSRAQGRLGFTRTRGAGRGGRGAVAQPREPLAAPPRVLESAHDEDEDETRARLQKLIEDVVGKFIMVPYDHWDYADEDAGEEPRQAVCTRVTEWNAEGTFFKAGRQRPFCAAPALPFSLLCQYALLVAACQGREVSDGALHEFSPEDVLKFTVQSGISDEPTVAPRRYKRLRDPIGEVRKDLSALLLAGGLSMLTLSPILAAPRRGNF